MKLFWDFVDIMILIDAVAFVVAFAIGMLVAPVLVLLDRAVWWKHRLKWTAVALFGSWFGLWMYRRSRKGAGGEPRARTAFASK